MNTQQKLDLSKQVFDYLLQLQLGNCHFQIARAEKALGLSEGEATFEQLYNHFYEVAKGAINKLSN
jgi:hypothetical protein